jgi:two-component system, OmpR family, sensor histidine kinase MprB
MSLRARIALAGGLAVLTALLAVSLVLFPVADRDLHDQLDSSLVTTAASAPQFTAKFKQRLAASGAQGITGTVFTVGDTLLEFVGPDDAVDPSPNDIAPFSVQDKELFSGALPAYFSSVKYDGRDYRTYTTLYNPVGDMLVRVARPESDAAAPLERLGLLLAGLILGGTVAAAFGARLLADRVLRPVRALTETVEHVTATQDLALDLDGRLDTGGRDEIGRLARSFAAMMAALDDSVQTQRRLVADASHELRTPLTSLTTNLELLAEAGGLADPQAPALLGSAREQSGELRSLVNDLVDLARYGRAETHREDVRLDLLAAAVVERAARRVSKPLFETKLDECFVHGDPDAIERALGNLVDNAVKWSPPEGVVHVRVSAEMLEAVFSVADEGPGILPDDLPHVFDRFYRSPAARSKPGSGLGLSIVRQIAETHGGRAVAHPLPVGIEMLLTFPRVR